MVPQVELETIDLQLPERVEQVVPQATNCKFISLMYRRRIEDISPFKYNKNIKVKLRVNTNSVL